MARSPFLFLRGILPVALAAACLAASYSARAETPHGDIALRVVNMLEEEHYLRKTFDDEMSARVFDGYLEMLDFNRVYFTAEDVAGFKEKYRSKIDDQVRSEDIPAAAEIYGVYKERVRNRVEFAKKLAKEGNFTYDSNRTVELSREDEDWATAGKEYNRLWRDMIEGELLREKLLAEATKEAEEKKAEEKAEETDADALNPGENAEEKPGEDKSGKAKGKKEPGQSGRAKPEKNQAKAAPGEKVRIEETDEDSEEKTPYEKISERYDRILKSVEENDEEDVASFFIKAIARAYDPHSEYFSQSEYENFRIGMNKSLTGIGAMLQVDPDGGASVEGLVVGGPAFNGGELKHKDKIIGVAQGEDGEMVDAIPMKLSDIVDLIRGDEGSTVRLKVRPADEPDSVKLVDIVRAKVDLKDSLANADLIHTVDPQGRDQKLGWIRLQSFYSDMDGGDTSTTADVRRLITRLSVDGIDGLVVDLRNNGGGSLEEAINMTGLFIRKGPVVQARDWRGNRTQKSSRSLSAYYDGPLVVLTNRASASASEIFAAALQDYNRAVVVGEKSTFGKGTVQQLRPIESGRLILPFRNPGSDQGALKLTIQTFFRINGDSTQLKGVVPDIRLPSTLDVAEIGEEALRNPLDVEPIPPAQYAPYFEEPLPIETLQKASESRVASDQSFAYVLEDIAREQKRLDENAASLNMEKRKAETEEREKRNEARKQERIERFARVREEEKDLFTLYTFTQSNVESEELTLKADMSEEELSGMSRGTADEEDEEEKALEYPHLLDPYERETIRIVQDLINIEASGRPVSFSDAGRKPREKTEPIAPASSQVAE